MNALKFVAKLDHPKLSADDSLAYASKLILHKELDFVPIVADNGDFFGVLDAKAIAESQTSDAPSDQILAWQICEREVCTVHPDDTLETALAKLQESESSFFAVVENSRYIGFATSMDLLDALKVPKQNRKDAKGKVA